MAFDNVVFALFMCLPLCVPVALLTELQYLRCMLCSAWLKKPCRNEVCRCFCASLVLLILSPIVVFTSKWYSLTMCERQNTVVCCFDYC